MTSSDPVDKRLVKLLDLTKGIQSRQSDIDIPGELPIDTSVVMTHNSTIIG